jgi:putrescine aminotransferase
MADQRPRRSTFEQARRHLSPGLAVAARLTGKGAVEAAAEGCTVRLSDGRSVLDFGSYGVALLGHRHPAVVAAVQHQLAVQPTASRTLLNPATAAAAEYLVDFLGGPLRRVWFGSNGSDAVECAVKLARVASGRRRVVSVSGGFHGKSMGALALTDHPRFRAGLDGLLVDVEHVPADRIDPVRRLVAAGDVAALVFEPVQGENGVRPLDPTVLAAWCRVASAHGTFVIADEVQSGLRRCGPRSIALAAGLPVDAVLLGKPLGGGVVPLSAAVCAERLYEPLATDPVLHTATFGGHPLACAALPAALDAIETYAERGPVIAAAIEVELGGLKKAHPDVIADVRGRGLLWGVELRSTDLARQLPVRLGQAGLLVSPCLGDDRTVRLLPPLVVSDDELGVALGIVADTVARLR